MALQSHHYAQFIARLRRELLPDGRPLPPFPTKATPGSPEKIAILRARRIAKISLWHPDDVTLHTSIFDIPWIRGVNGRDLAQPITGDEEE